MKKSRGLVRSDASYNFCVLQFAEGITGHGERSHAVQTVFWLPRVGGQTSHLKFNRQSRSLWFLAIGNVGVDSGGESVENVLGVGRIAFVFGLHIPAIRQQTGVDVAQERGGADNFG